MAAAGELAPSDPNYPDFRTTEGYVTQPPPPVQEPDWEAVQAQNEANWAVLSKRATREEPRRTAGLEWSAYPDPLMHLFMPQFWMTESDMMPYMRKQAQLRILEVAQALEHHGFEPINLGSPLQRAALAGILQPFYDCYENYLRGHTEFKYLFNQHLEVKIQYRWFMLHNYLVKHGFSVEKVQEFIVEEESANTSPWAPPPCWAFRRMNMNEEYLDEDLAGADRASLQFAENYTPTNQRALAMRAAYENGMQLRLAQAMGTHARLGANASPYVRGGFPRDTMDMIQSFT